MINRIYNFLKFATNNAVDGNVSPTEYNVSLYNNMLVRYEGYFADLNRFLNRENRGLISSGLADIPKNVAEKISHFLLPVVLTGAVDSVADPSAIFYSIPSDCRYVDLFLNSTNDRPIEVAKSGVHFEAVRRLKETAPTLENPLAVRQGSRYRVSPITLTSARMYYLRNPKIPNWTFTTPLTGEALYNPSDAAFVDVDMHISEESALTIMVLADFGINLKEPDLAQMAQSEEMKEFQKQTTL